MDSNGRSGGGGGSGGGNGGASMFGDSMLSRAASVAMGMASRSDTVIYDDANAAAAAAAYAAADAAAATDALSATNVSNKDVVTGAADGIEPRVSVDGAHTVHAGVADAAVRLHPGRVRQQLRRHKRVWKQQPLRQQHELVWRWHGRLRK